VGKIKLQYPRNFVSEFSAGSVTASEVVLYGCRRMLYCVALNSEHVVLNIVFLFFQVSEVTSHPLYHVESKVSEAESFRKRNYTHTHTHTHTRTYIHA